MITSERCGVIKGQYTQYFDKMCTAQIIKMGEYKSSPEECMAWCDGNSGCGGFGVLDPATFDNNKDCYFRELKCKDDIIASSSVVLYVKNN